MSSGSGWGSCLAWGKCGYTMLINFTLVSWLRGEKGGVWELLPPALAFLAAGWDFFRYALFPLHNSAALCSASKWVESTKNEQVDGRKGKRGEKSGKMKGWSKGSRQEKGGRHVAVFSRLSYLLFPCASLSFSRSLSLFVGHATIVVVCRRAAKWVKLECFFQTFPDASVLQHFTTSARSCKCNFLGAL